MNSNSLFAYSEFLKIEKFVSEDNLIKIFTSSVLPTAFVLTVSNFQVLLSSLFAFGSGTFLNNVLIESPCRATANPLPSEDNCYADCLIIGVEGGKEQKAKLRV